MDMEYVRKEMKNTERFGSLKLERYFLRDLDTKILDIGIFWRNLFGKE